jgi:hypothetical protein
MKPQRPQNPEATDYNIPVCQTARSTRRPPEKPKVRKVIRRCGCCAMALAELK